MRLPVHTGRRLIAVAAVYVVGFVVIRVLVDGVPDRPDALVDGLDPVVALLAFVFETVDSAAGMGFGTALAPLLFVLGFAPLEVVPALLAAEAATGLLAGWLHQEFRNIELGWRPPNDAARTLLLIGGLGAAGVAASAAIAYFAVPLPEKIIKAYVAILVLVMGASTLARPWITPRGAYRPKRLVAFAALAGVNKGLGGGGFGPVITLGSIFSGIIEKSATAISTLAEGCVSTVGLAAFLTIAAIGAPVDLRLLPSLWLGAFPAAVIAPYAVRVLPNRIFRYAVPVYALAIAGAMLVQLFLGA